MGGSSPVDTSDTGQPDVQQSRSTRGPQQLVMLAQPPESPPLAVPPPMAPPLSPALCHESGHESRGMPRLGRASAGPPGARGGRLQRTVTPWRPATVPASVRQPGRGWTRTLRSIERRRLQRERERDRRATERNLGESWVVGRGLVKRKCEEEKDEWHHCWRGCGSVKRKAASLLHLYAEWSSYSAPTLIFQNRLVASLTVSSHQTASRKPAGLEKCSFGSRATFGCETGRSSLELWHQSSPRAEAY